MGMYLYLNVLVILKGKAGFYDIKISVIRYAYLRFQIVAHRIGVDNGYGAFCVGLFREEY